MTHVSREYDLAVIGAGAAGLTAAEVALQLGVRVALVEKAQIGGECTWTGCIPSKALLAAAKMAHNARHAGQFGVSVGAVQVDFSQVMAYVHSTIQAVYQQESAAELCEKGIDVYHAAAKFSAPHRLTLSDATEIHAKYILLSTGARPFVPNGFCDVPHLTNENLFELETRPEHLIIIGGGPIGTEMAQAFGRLGAHVTLISDMPRLLPRDEPEAAELVQAVLEEEGVCLKLGVPALDAVGEVGNITVRLADSTHVNGSHLLIAVGKRADVSPLNPVGAGLETRQNRLVVKRNLQTSQPHIYAAGDVVGGAQFTHYASWQGAIAVRNMFLPRPANAIRATVPWATFTDPEIAHAGLTEAQARTQYNDAVDVTALPMTRADRAMTEGGHKGFIKLIHKPDGRLLGATIVGYNAAEMMNEWVGVIDQGSKVSDVTSTLHIYPTLGVTNALLATEQMKKQYASGLPAWLLRKFVQLRL